MTGTVTANLEAVLRLRVQDASGQSNDIDAVIDTGDIVDWGSTAETQYV